MKKVSLTRKVHAIRAQARSIGQRFTTYKSKAKPRTCGDLLDSLEKDFEGIQLIQPRMREILRAGRGRSRVR